MTSEDEIQAWADAYARENGWVLNPDSTVLAPVIHGLARNERRFGVRYCPCIYHRDEIEQDGHCHCRLYYRKDATGPETGGPE